MGTTELLELLVERNKKIAGLNDKRVRRQKWHLTEREKAPLADVLRRIDEELGKKKPKVDTSPSFDDFRKSNADKDVNWCVGERTRRQSKRHP